jgi:hypothetical protein|tara:strand:+ start:275 stop:406 length:132 start_codon:yes stop_codon:yes gene_type:complete
MIGNAVAVNFAEILAKQIKSTLEGIKEVNKAEKDKDLSSSIAI